MAGSHGAQVVAVPSAPPTTPKTVVLKLTSDTPPGEDSEAVSANSGKTKFADLVLSGQARLEPPSVVLNLPDEAVETQVELAGLTTGGEAAPEPVADDSLEDISDTRPVSPEYIEATATTTADANATAEAVAGAAKAVLANIPEPPPGTGPLYKCALCGILVYESQLDYHVIICPDPADITERRGAGNADDQPEVAGSEAKLAAAAATAEEVSPPRGPSSKMAEARSASPEPNGTGGSASSRQRGWSGSRKESKSQLEEHIDTQTRRVDARRQQIVSELRKRETEECTFAPKINSRGSPKTCTRICDASGEVRRWSQRGVEHQRNQKLKQVEAQAYADVTLRPKVSRFAEVWSEKQKQAQTQAGRPVPSVYERLYLAAVQAAQARELRKEEPLAIDDPSVRSSIGTQGEIVSATPTPGTSLGSISTACGDGVPPSTPERTTVVLATSSTTGGRFAPQPRRVSTSQLLYDDSFDRRERLKSLSEQLFLNSEEAMRDKSQVLSRSRRYYWQMLERQIKVAFEAASGGEPTLQYSQLEDFLIRFGCIKDKVSKTPGGNTSGIAAQASKTPGGNTSGTASQAIELESRKLRDALWRHLDPQKAGRIDLLTMTVFFHVLMGAVDGAEDASTKGAANFPPMTTVDEEADSTKESPRTSPLVSRRNVASPTTRTRGENAEMNGTDSSTSPGERGNTCQSEGTSKDVSPGASPSPGRRGSGGPLAAIFEDEGTDERKEVPGSPVPRLDASEPENTCIDDEGHRICELLVRFDPFRLRAEFQQLYLHRLHNCSAQAGGHKSEDSQILVPDINSKSRVVAEKLIERQKGESGGTLMQHADLLLWRHNQVEAKKEDKRAQAKNEEVSGCTFRPKTNARPHDGPLEVAACGSSRHEVLYARAVAGKERKDAKAQQESKARSKNEVKGCTFKPDTGKSERSYKSANDGTVPVPRGFYETRTRLRQAHEIQMQKTQQREDRLTKLTPVMGKVGLINSMAPTVVPEKPPTPAPGADPTSPLLPVAEEQDRRRPKSVDRRTNGEPVRSRSARSPGARQSPRGQSPRGGAPQSARGSQARSVSNSGRGHSTNHSPAPNSTASPSTPRDMACSRQGPAVSNSGTTLSNANSTGSCAPTDGAAANSTAVEEEDDQPPPLLYVDVNIAPGQPPERIILREGQSVTEVAADFAAKHVLTPALAQRLHGLLKEVLQKQDLSQARGS